MLGFGTHKVNGDTIVVDEHELKTKLYLLMVAINILEGVRFYVSFACTWAFAESMHIMEKSAKIIKMICRDENLHLAITSHILKKWRDGSEGPLMAQIAAECEPQVYDMFADAVLQEEQWAEYLFSKGSIVGLNADILKEYVQFIANKRMRTLGLKGPYNQPSNPLPWTEHWVSSKDTQVAPQEEEITSYLIGGINNDIGSDTFAGLKL
jgi:ribonucleoside-diphosphate reductase beta chain